MKKPFYALIVFVVVVLASSCSTYAARVTNYEETIAKVKDHDVLGPVVLTVTIKNAEFLYEDSSSAGFREEVIRQAREQYPDADDVVNVTISLGASSKIEGTFYVVEGDAIKYL